jgi:hypothetical protein
MVESIQGFHKCGGHFNKSTQGANKRKYLFLTTRRTLINIRYKVAATVKTSRLGSKAVVTLLLLQCFCMICSVMVRNMDDII